MTFTRTGFRPIQINSDQFRSVQISSDESRQIRSNSDQVKANKINLDADQFKINSDKYNNEGISPHVRNFRWVAVPRLEGQISRTSGAGEQRRGSCLEKASHRPHVGGAGETPRGFPRAGDSGSASATTRSPRTANARAQRLHQRWLQPRLACNVIPAEC